MRDEWPSYDEWPYALEEESFLDHYEDEIGDRVIPALDPDKVAEVITFGCYRCGHEASAIDPCECSMPLPWSQLTLFGGAY